ncbi:MAG: DUF5050 domain-containing protein [Clostridium sp.]|nr:DUF5050 domain-containing protein [Clostridium sp.]
MKNIICAAMLAVVMAFVGMEPGWRIMQQNEADIVVVDMDGEKIYLSEEDIIDEKKAGEWVYFRYMQESSDDDYPVLCRYKENERMAERVTEGSCYTYEVAGGHVYYLNSIIAFQDHGELYISEPDGKNTRMLEEELHDFQIVDEKYIYYTYRHDTYGVGLEGHALHRMNLDGSNSMIAAYEVSGADDIGASHFKYKVVDGWVDCGTFKMELGEPADGYEKIVCKEIGDNDWIYYVTNRLMKARRDGSEQMELDGVCDYYYEVVKVVDDWIYYYKGGMPYRIRTDGSELETVTQKEMYSI